MSRVRSKEQTLLTGSVMESLLAANDYSECLRLLSDHGWNTDNAKENPGAMLKEERDKTWSFISEVVPDRHAFDVFRIANDYHNLKAAIKNTLAKLNEGIYMDKDMCTIDPALIQKAVSDRNFTELPGEMEKVAEEALNTLLHTGDGQMCDIIIDKAALEGINYIGNFCYDAGSNLCEMVEQEREGKTRCGTGDVFSSIIAADAVNGVDFKKSVMRASTFIKKCVETSIQLDIPLTDGVAFEEILDELPVENKET